MTDNFTSRRRTPPELKWLLNEHAALAGQIAQTSTVLASIRTRVNVLNSALAELLPQLHEGEKALAKKQEVFLALGHTLRLLEPSVNPAAAGVVSPWAGKYGKRGGLQEFLAELLRGCAPLSMDTRALMSAAAQHFGLPCGIPELRKKVRQNVTDGLRELQTKGLVRMLPKAKPNSILRWVWASDVLPSIDELRAYLEVANEPGDGPDDTPSHPS